MNKGQIFITLRAKKVLDQATIEADMLKDEYVSPEHVFLAIANERNTPASRVLEWANLTHLRILATIKELREEKNALLPKPDKPMTSRKAKKKLPPNNDVFIVHGHDEAMKQSVARIIEKLGLNAVILHEKPNQGKTIIEKFTEHSNVGFAIVLLSPDDVFLPKDSSSDKKLFHARQNVIFELGFFIGKLGRDKVLSLYRRSDSFELPSDYSGVLFVPFDEHNHWRLDLIRELKASGYELDANKLLE